MFTFLEDLEAEEKRICNERRQAQHTPVCKSRSDFKALAWNFLRPIEELENDAIESGNYLSGKRCCTLDLS